MLSPASSTVFVSDLQRALPFYTEVLDGAVVSSDDSCATVRLADGADITLTVRDEPAAEPGEPLRGSLRAGFETREPIQAVVRRLRDRGVVFRGPITGSDGSRVRLAFFDDPDGNVLYVMGPCRPRARGTGTMPTC